MMDLAGINENVNEETSDPDMKELQHILYKLYTDLDKSRKDVNRMHKPISKAENYYSLDALENLQDKLDDVFNAVKNMHDGIKKGIYESINEGKKDYTIHHKSLTAAVQEVLDYVEKNGYTIDEDDWFNRVSTGPRKPTEGHTNSYHLDLYKDGKEVKNRKVHFQVYGLENGYELNMYIS